MKRAILASTAAVAAVVAAVAAGACADPPAPVICKDIPAGGCPLSHGVACDDPSCAAVYSCNAGAWTLDHDCAARDGGADASPDAPGDAPARDATFDAPPGAYGGPGCADLQPPDCSLGFALACPNDQCCDCTDLFVCGDGGWSAWGSCSPDGGIVQR